MKVMFVGSAIVTVTVAIALYLRQEHLSASSHMHTTASEKKVESGRGRGAQHTHKLAVSSESLDGLPVDVRAALDPSVDPCEDFYEFSCGGWEKITTIPTWQSSWAKQWDGVNTAVEHMTVKALEEDTGKLSLRSWPTRRALVPWR